MNAKTSVFVICVEAIIYLLSYNLHDLSFNVDILQKKFTEKANKIALRANNNNRI